MHAPGAAEVPGRAERGCQCAPGRWAWMPRVRSTAPLVWPGRQRGRVGGQPVQPASPGFFSRARRAG
eukprot:4649760-Lingulodinium_polyedra.AAC.1